MGEWGVQMVTSQGSAHFQKTSGSKRKEMASYSARSLRDLGQACKISWTWKSWSWTSAMFKVVSNQHRTNIRDTNSLVNHWSLSTESDGADNDGRMLEMGRGRSDVLRHGTCALFADPIPVTDLNKVITSDCEYRYKKHISFYFFPGRARASATVIFQAYQKIHASQPSILTTFSRILQMRRNSRINRRRSSKNTLNMFMISRLNSSMEFT